MLRIVILPHVFADRKSPVQQETTYSSNLIDQTSDGHDPVTCDCAYFLFYPPVSYDFMYRYALGALGAELGCKRGEQTSSHGNIAQDWIEEGVNTEKLEQQWLASHPELLIHR